MPVSVKNIFPLIVPASYYAKGTWELPHYRLPNESFLLTWAVFGNDNSMPYLTNDQFISLNSENKNWQQEAFENLRYSIDNNEMFFTHFKISEDQSRLIFLSFIHSDGIGSSRILLSSELQRIFPNGYYVAFPDRSCGLVISKDISEGELAETKDLVQSMYQEATIPMSKQLYSDDDFTLPELLVKPIDIDRSQFFVKEALKLSPKK
jgi:hypothetical protein